MSKQSFIFSPSLLFGMRENSVFTGLLLTLLFPVISFASLFYLHNVSNLHAFTLECANLAGSQQMLNISLSFSQPFEITLLRILFRSVPHFSFGLFSLLMFSFLEFILCIRSQHSVRWLVKIFSYSVGYHFVLLMSFALQKHFSFMRSIY